MRRENCIKKINEYIAEYYDLLDEGDTSDMAKRYIKRLYDTIDGMCIAYAILFGVEVEWGRKGFSFHA